MLGILSPREVLQAYLETEIARFLYFLSHRRSSEARATVILCRRPPLTERDLAARSSASRKQARVVDERLSAANVVTTITCPANVLTLSAGRIVWIPRIRSTQKKKKKKKRTPTVIALFSQRVKARVDTYAKRRSRTPQNAYTFRILAVPLLQRDS